MIKQASALSTLNTNTDKFQSTIETNNSTVKSEILNSFKTEWNETLQNNKTVLSLQLSTDLDNKFMQFQS